jgi:hypothetical protein
MFELSEIQLVHTLSVTKCNANTIFMGFCSAAKNSQAGKEACQ